MAIIGSKGGTEISKDEEHMAEIDRMGGKRSRTNGKKKLPRKVKRRVEQTLDLH